MEGIIYEDADDAVSEKDDFYSTNLLESYVEDDEISPVEEGFMAGYMGS